MKRIVILLLAGAVCACARSSKSGESTTPQVRVDNDIIAVAPGSPVLERLATGKVTATPYRATFTTSGMVQAIPARYAEIATPFAGRIVKSFVRLGQKVVQGSPISKSARRRSSTRARPITRPSRRWSSRSKA